MPKQPRRQKHLYLLLHDKASMFRLHKIDVDDMLPSDSDHAAAAGELRLLPEPPALQLVEKSPYRPVFAVAMGTNIFLTTYRPYVGQTPTLVYNTETAALAMDGPRLPDFTFCPEVAGDEKLYVLTRDRSTRRFSFEVLSWAPNPAAATERFLPSHHWSWESAPTPPPFDGDVIVASHAVHPDGRTIFVSMRGTHDRSRGRGTYSFDTGSSGSEWRCHGSWMLPFDGRGHFDGELEAWVGLRGDGRVCACRVASSDAGGEAPEWKTVAGTLFRAGPKTHLSATLTYLGDARFCLVESAMRQEEHFIGPGVRHGCALHVTLFGLKYDWEGELQTSVRRATASYAVSKQHVLCGHTAFWM